MGRYKHACFVVITTLGVLFLLLTTLERFIPTTPTQKLALILLVCIWPILAMPKILYNLRCQSGPHRHQYRAFCRMLTQALPYHRRVLATLGIKPMPSYLMVGTPQSGKTQLLEPATPLKCHLDKFSIYRYGEQIIIDTPGISDVSDVAWLIPLLQAFKFHWHQTPIQSILITIDTEQIRQPFTTQLISVVEKSLHAVSHRIDRWPSIQVMITKCDEIPHFVDSFENLSPIEKQAKFGLMFKRKNVINNPEQAFNRRFEQLIDHIQQYVKDDKNNHTLTYRLHDMKDCLLSWTKHISKASLYLRGIFFSSTRTEPALFTQEWLLQTHTHPITRCHTRPILSIAAAVGLLTLMLLTGYKIYHDNQLEITHLQQQLNATAQSKDPLIAELNKLERAKAQISQHANKTVTLDEVKTLEATIINQYYQILNQQFLSHARGTLENELAQLSSNSIKDFSVYMMLCSNQPRNNQAIIEWFEKHWRRQNRLPADKAHYLRHLHALLAQPSVSCPINRTLIAKAKNYLDHIPEEALVISLAQTEIENKKQDSSYAKSIKQVSDLTDIPAIYTYANYHAMIDQALEANYRELQKYQGRPLNQDVLEKSKQLYIQTYINLWRQATHDIKIPDFNTLPEADHVISTVKQSLPKSLAVIAENTQHPEDRDFSRHITRPFNKTNAVPTPVMLTQIESWLEQLHQITKKTQSQEVIAFCQNRMKRHPRDALSYLKQTAGNYPPMVENWLKQMVQKVWQIMLEQAHKSLNERWQINVFKPYQETISGLFPFAMDSTSELSAKSFTEFFGKEGAIVIFTNELLDPFIEKNKGIWSWKRIDGIGLSDQKDVLETLMTAQFIHSMFFESSDQPAYSLTLQPTTLSPTLSQITFTWDNHEIKINPMKKTKIPVQIPMQTASLTINFLNNRQVSASQVYTGIWAWIKALDTSINAHNATSNTVKLTHQDEDVEFTIQPKNKMTALSSNLFSTFHCKKSI